MRHFTLLLLIPCLICTMLGQGAAERPVYTTVLLKGNLSVSIDGDLSEWSAIEAVSQPLTGWMKVRNWLMEDPFLKENFQGPEDLSASFRAFADQDYLYVVVEVADDRLVFGDSQTYGRGGHDDMVHIYLDGDLEKKNTEILIPMRSDYDDNDSVIGITRNQNGMVVLEGSLLETRIMAPYLWNAVGVQAAVREQKDGYVVEVQIPRDVLGLEAFRKGTKIGLNVAVTDDDDGGWRDNKLGWSGDVENLGSLTTVNIGHLILGSEQTLLQVPKAKDAFPQHDYIKQIRHPATKPTNVPELPSEFLAKVREGEGGRLIVTLTDDELVRHRIGINELHSGNIEIVRQYLAAIKAEAPESKHVIWAAGLVSALAQPQGRYDEALQALDDIDHAARDPRIMNWNSQRRLRLITSQAKQFERTSRLDEAAALWKQSIQSAVDLTERKSVRQDRMVTSYVLDALLANSFPMLVELHAQRRDQENADNVRWEAIDHYNKVLRVPSYAKENLGRKALRRRLRYRLYFGEDALASKEVEHYLKTIADYPNHVTLALVQIGNTYRQAKRYEKSLAFYQRALELSQGIGTAAMEAYHESGLTHCALGDWQKAIERFETVLAKDTQSNPYGTYRIPAAHYWMARAYERIGDYGTVEDLLNGLLQKYAGYPDHTGSMEKARSLLSELKILGQIRAHNF